MSGVIEGGKSKNLKDHVREIEDTVKSLEENLKDTNRADNQVMMAIQNDKIKCQGISNQLEEALKENQCLLNILQHKSTDEDVSRTNSQGDVSRSCSTMSIVHLQYKYCYYPLGIFLYKIHPLSRYEELLANHRGLLKLLDLKSEEIKKVHEENIRLRNEVEQIKQIVSENKEKYSKLLTKFSKLKERKDGKIKKLKVHRETLQMAHNQLVNVLHTQCMEKDSIILDEIRNCGDSEKALLLQEIRKNNMLAYENFHLSQQVEFLKSMVEAEHKRKYQIT